MAYLNVTRTVPLADVRAIAPSPLNGEYAVLWYCEAWGHAVAGHASAADLAPLVFRDWTHRSDSDCTPYLTPDDGETMRECTACGVTHGEACGLCGGTGFHRTMTCGHECPESDTWHDGPRCPNWDGYNTRVCADATEA